MRYVILYSFADTVIVVVTNCTYTYTTASPLSRRRVSSASRGFDAREISCFETLFVIRPRGAIERKRRNKERNWEEMQEQRGLGQSALYEGRLRDMNSAACADRSARYRRTAFCWPLGCLIARWTRLISASWCATWNFRKGCPMRRALSDRERIRVSAQPADYVSCRSTRFSFDPWVISTTDLTKDIRQITR